MAPPTTAPTAQDKALDGSASGAAAIELTGVTKRYGEVLAVDDLDVTIAQGEFFALLGPSGCGKTSTLKMMAGFETPDAGEIRLEGKVVTMTPPFHRDVNLVFQDYALFPHLNLRDNVAFGLKIKGVGRGSGAGAPTRCSSGWRSPVSVTAASPRSPAASSSGSRWPGR